MKNDISVLTYLLLIFVLIPIGLKAQTANNFSAPPLWQARGYTSERISSYDTTGANDDGNWQNKIQPGETRVIANVKGPGIIRHIWMTIATSEPYHLKKLC